MKTAYSRGLTKFPYQITGVATGENSLYITTSTCTYKDDYLGNSPKLVNVPGKLNYIISSPLNGVIKVNISAHKVTNEELPLIISSRSQAAKIEETENYISFKTGTLEARFNKSIPFSIEYYYLDKKITSSSPLGAAFYRTNSGSGNYYEVDTTSSVIGDSLLLTPGETLYGLGGSGTLTLNGRNEIINNLTFPETCQKVPFFVSSENYGILVNTLGKAEFNFGTRSSTVDFSVAGESIEYEVFAGNSICEVLTSYAGFAGSSSPVPSWSMGTALSINNDFSVTDLDILDTVQKLINSGVTVTELWLGNSYLPQDDVFGFNWDLERFPDPAAFCRKLHDKGIRVGVSVNPYISESSYEYQECLDCNYLLRNDNDEVYLWDGINGGTAIIDLTYMAARSWFALRCDALLKQSVDFLKADFSYKLVDYVSNKVNNPVFVNSFAGCFNQVVRDSVMANKNLANLMILADSTSAGDHTYPFRNIATSNQSVTFGEMYNAMNKAISYGMSGYGSVNIDVPDILSTNPALFTRWAEMAMMTGHFRIETSINELNSAMNSETFSTLKMFSDMRYGMIPYIYSACLEASSFGTPVIRPTSLVFPHDQLAKSASNQFMLGSSILIAPVFSDNGNVNFYLPAGIWTNLLTRERIQGPRIVSRKEPMNTMPIFAAPNSVIATCPPNTGKIGNYMDNLTLTVFEPADGKIAAAEVFAPNSNTSSVVNVLKEGNKITIKTSGFGHSKRIVLAGIKNVVSVSESMPEINEFGTTIEFMSNELVVTLG